MKHYAGLDVSVKETAICIVDENGRICRETKVVSHPEDLSKALTETGFRIERIGLEAGPLSQWLFEGMALAGLPVICGETRHTKAFQRAQINKSDRNDARGIAQMMRVNLYCQVAGIRYALTRMERLRPYLDHGTLELDNNPAERGMRAIALGRKNYLFVGSEGGGKAAAIAYTLIETAKVNVADPHAWLADTIARIPDYKINKVDDLLPWRWNG